MADHLEQPAASMGAPDAQTRQQQLEQLYYCNFAYILETALEDRRLTQADAWQIVDGVTGHLPDYDGDLADEVVFQTWVTEIIKPAVAFVGIMRQSQRIVYSGIWSVLKPCADLGCDGGTADDIASQVWAWALENLDSLLDPNQPAKPSTRLRGQAYWYARAEKTRRVRSKNRFFDVEDLSKVGVGLDGTISVRVPCRQRRGHTYYNW